MLKHAIRTRVRNCYIVSRTARNIFSSVFFNESRNADLVHTNTEKSPDLTRLGESKNISVKRDSKGLQSPGVAHLVQSITPYKPEDNCSCISSNSVSGNRESIRLDPTHNKADQAIFVDVESLAPYEIAHAQNEVDYRAVWVSSHELSDTLPTVSHEVIRRENALLHPLTSKELVYRLHEATAFRPLPSLSRIIEYHSSYPSLQSSTSYNFLIQLCIRHTAYSVAFKLLRSMKTLGIAPTHYTSLLHIRLLIRSGRCDEAWSLVCTELATRNRYHGLAALLEMLGQRKSFQFTSKNLTDDVCTQNSTWSERTHSSVNDTTLPSLQSKLLSFLAEILPQDFVPSDRFIYIVVRFLLQNSQKKVAQEMTMMWLSSLPRYLSSVRQRHCLQVLHLHLGLSGKGANAHFANRRLVDKVVELCPSIRPDSSTLFLLLGSLNSSAVKPTFNALRLVEAYKKKWGNDIIDKRVRRRIASIATREGQTRVARKWVEMQKEAEKSNDVAYSRHVLGQDSIKHSDISRDIPYRKMMPGVEAEKRKWRWLLRRLERRERAQVKTDTDMETDRCA